MNCVTIDDRLHSQSGVGDRVCVYPDAARSCPEGISVHSGCQSKGVCLDKNPPLLRWIMPYRLVDRQCNHHTCGRKVVYRKSRRKQCMV